ncbi:protease modulator HflC [Fulvimarina sp. 2208YS6-2-32]|uniref:protease modulator HflC n=1 Tax=Fulvimarina uroteuthidis TaxID=3098149 RepID=UPI003A102DD7
MANRFYALIAAIAVVLLVVWNSIFIVNEKEQAIVLRFGEIQRVVEEPGLYFKMPFGFAGADNVQMLPDRLLRFDLDDIRVQVSGGRFYVVDAFLVYNISDAAQFRRTVSGSIPQAEQRLRTRLDAALRRVYGLRGFEDALSNERGEMMRQVRDEIVEDAASLGIQLTDVRIRRTDLTDEVSQQTYERMQAERLAEAERLRARGQVAAREIRAGADRTVVETKAAARRDAEILQGQGDAERNRVFGEAFSADPEFFDFYRSMSAYRVALENSGTTLVLSPDSEFFRYFQNDAVRQGNASGSTPSFPLLTPQTGAQTGTDAGTQPRAGAGETGAAGDEGAAAGDIPGVIDLREAAAEAAADTPPVVTPDEPAAADTPADAAGTAGTPADAGTGEAEPQDNPAQ